MHNLHVGPYHWTCIDFLIIFQRSYIAGAVKHNTLGLKMQSPMEIFTGSVSFGQLVLTAIVAFRAETRSNSLETKLFSLNITVCALKDEFSTLKVTVDELSRNAIRKFW
jgi:hypothetical protein